MQFYISNNYVGGGNWIKGVKRVSTVPGENRCGLKGTRTVISLRNKKKFILHKHVKMLLIKLV